MASLSAEMVEQVISREVAEYISVRRAGFFAG